MDLPREAPDPPLRVVHVVEALNAGVGRHVVDLVVHRPAGHQALVVGPRVDGPRAEPELVAALRAAGAGVAHLDLHRVPRRPSDVATLAGLVALLRVERPDVVHTHATGGGLAGRPAARVLGLPVVHTPNGLIPSAPVLRVEALLARATDRVVAVSESEARLLRASGVPADRVVVVPNASTPPDREGAGPDVPDLRAAAGPGDGPVVVTVARLVRQKAPEVVAAAARLVAARRPDVRWLVVGDGPLRDVVGTAAAAPPALRRVEHLPGVGRALAGADLLVLPSRYEGLPFVVAEAAAAGVPAVVTRVTGNVDAVRDGVTGLVVPPQDPAAVADAVLDLLADDARRQALGRAAREVAQAWTAADQAARTFEVYRDVLRRRRLTVAACGGA